MVTASAASASLNARFPQADAALVEDLAACVAIGRVTMEQAVQSLKDMGYPEKEMVASPLLATTAVPQQASVEPSGLPPRRPVLQRSGALPFADDLGGEARPERTLQGHSKEQVAAWVDNHAVYAPGAGVNVHQWREGVASPASPPRPSYGSAATHVVPTSRTEIIPDVVPDVSPVKENDEYYAATYNQTTLHSSAKAGVNPASMYAPVPSSLRSNAAARSRSAATGARSVPVGPVVAPPVTPATSEILDAEIRLYMTTMTADRQVRDRVRSFERLLFLLAIPHQAYDVSENRFMRRKLVELCGGEDRGLPLLFVGDRVVGVFDEVQEMVDRDEFIPRLVALGAVLPKAVLDAHQAKIDNTDLGPPATTVEAKPLSPPRAPPSPSVAPGGHSTRPVLSPAVNRPPTVLQAAGGGASRKPTMDPEEYDRRLKRLLELL